MTSARPTTTKRECPEDREDLRRESLEEEFRSTIEEARMVLPGVQALFGFQLIAVFSATFGKLPERCVDIHVGSLLLVALSIALIMTPAAYHRVAERGWMSRSFCTLASRLVASAMVPLAIGLCLEIYVVVVGATRDVSLALMLASGAAFVFLAAWFVYPLITVLRARTHQ